MEYEWQAIGKPPDHSDWVELKTSCFLHKIRGYFYKGEWHYKDPVDYDYLPIGAEPEIILVDFPEFLIEWKDIKQP